MTLTSGPGLIVFLLFVATLVAIGARRLRLPVMVGLLVAGIALAFMPWIGRGIGLTGRVLFTALLPPLVFEGALNIRWRELRADLGLIVVLATVGVLLSLAIVAALMHWLAGWTWQAALIFGAIIAATDPIAVLASFKEAGIGGRARLIVEAESLLNDATAVMAFALIISVTTTGGHHSSVAILGGFARMALVGVLTGIATGWLLTLLMGTVDDPLTETTLTMVGAYGAYYLADHFGGSGILATVCAGLIMGNVGILGGSFVTARGREITEGFWSFAAFIANTFVFLLMGMTIGHTSFAGRWLVIAAGIVAALAGRAAMVYSISRLFRGSNRPPRILQRILDWTGKRRGLGTAFAVRLYNFYRGSRQLPIALQHVLVWGGQRGGLGLVLALSAPAALGVNRSDVIAAVFGVVAFSVLVQAMTLAPFMRRLGLLTTETDPTARATKRVTVGPPR